MMISFTAQAKSEIIKALAAIPKEEAYYFRVGIKGDACNGSLLIGLDTKKQDDELHIHDDIAIIISKKHFMYVIGTHVSYNEIDGQGTFNAAII